jgi:ubiquinone/menaquinone biosynthesis C-methylase UbiE/glutaredoxin
MRNQGRISTYPGQPITLYGAPWCGDCRRATHWLDTHGIAYDYINIDHDAQAAAQVLRINGGLRSVPTIVLPDGSVLVEPSHQELADRILVTTLSRVEPEIPEAQPLEDIELLDSSQAIARSGTMTYQSVHNDSVRAKELSTYPRFSKLYNRLMEKPFVRLMFDPLRYETAGHSYGVVLEVGAGGGQNFPFYDPALVVRVEAIEPDAVMLAEARQAQQAAPVPVQLTRASVEALPFPNGYFDSAVVSLVFCSVSEPEQGLRELWRVLKPGGSVFLLEHVRAPSRILAGFQSALVPLTTRLMGNCHWDRDTLRSMQHVGFQIVQSRQVSGGLQPMFCLHATRPE